MNINQLKYVLEVSRGSSMREAATKLYISQPALSASIRELEEELGILIFERTNKGISLTDEGREFVEYAKKSVNQYEVLEERYLSRDSDKERFSVSTQHYSFPVKAFTEVVKKNEPDSRQHDGCQQHRQTCISLCSLHFLPVHIYYFAKVTLFREITKLFCSFLLKE